MARIGFIGLGNMGLPMAQNLLKAGHAVTGFDVAKAAVERLSAAGGAAATSVAEACAGADVVDHHAAGRRARARGLSPSRRACWRASRPARC